MGIAITKINAQRTLMVKAMTIEPRTIKGPSKKKAKTHIYAVLDLIHVISETGDERIRSQGIQLGKREALDVVKDRLTEIGGEADAGFRCKILGQ